MNHEPAPDAPDLSATAAPRRRRAATIRDVAQAAGVSTATVSKFLNGGQRFTREVEERVAQAVRDLGYSSNPMARGMITGRTGNVGIVVLDVRNPHFTSLIRGASRPAAEAGLNLLFADIAEGQGLEIGDAIEMVRVRIPRSEVADGDWMDTAWVLRHEFPDTFELMIIEIQDRLRRAAEAAAAPVADAAEPGVPRLDEDDDESAI